jgi:hypothetical protein
MAKITSNQYTKVVWIPDSQMTTTQAAAPTVTILNGASAQDLSPAIAWNNFALANAASDTVTDRGITDSGNAQSRGFSNFAGTLDFFREADQTNTTSDFAKAFATFKTPRTLGWLVIRPAVQLWSTPFAAGDRISVYRFIADIVTDDVSGDDAVKFEVSFLAQGLEFPYTMVAGSTASAISGVGTTLSKTVAGGPFALVPLLNGLDVHALATYQSSDSTKALVSANGVVTPIATGSVTITTTVPGALAPVSTVVTLT